MTISEPQTSFIPKKSVAPETESRRSGSVNLFFSLSLILFFISLAGAGGVYFWNILLEKQITNMAVSLDRAKAAFEPSLILELKNVNARMNVTQGLLDNHYAFSQFFELLEQLTLRTVRFTDFSYELGADGIQIIMKGEAKGYSSIALQSDAFAESPYIKNPVFSSVTLTDKGTVTFNFTALVDSSVVSYTRAVNAQ